MDASKAQLSIRVEDSGVGIEADALQNIFNQFNQADASTTRRFGGSGLGLAISKAIIEQMNGTISVTSTVGQGSIVTATLDVAIDAEEERKRQDTLQVLAGKRILCLSDYEGVLDTIMPHMKFWGISLDTLYDLTEAKARLETLETSGPSPPAFTFLKPFPPLDGDQA